ncbi:MFS transporter [Winogradskya humida]|uniref:Tetracycline resistance MFS efflux pump n=1 Tax=Winogradskya humida TaxID=113566 RepID=A0ABQ3ZKI9_9ACTN|nr:MFS transporter [Actinoplanes humidus]GIE19078.1 tetracycline resistance MFS efflux pump [Actinoplanes humidus]
MRRAPALSFLLITVFLDLLSLGLIVPIVPALLTTVTGDAADAVRWSGLLGSTFGLLQFVVAPLLGQLSDRYGRRPVLLTSLACLGVDWLAHAISPDPWTLLAFHALAGACAGTNTVVNAYVADIIEPRGRARAYGLIGAAFSCGFVAGPTIGGLLGAMDVRLPFFAAAALCFANVAYGWFVLPESRPGDRTTPLTLRTANPIGALTAVLRRPTLGRLAHARLYSDIARMTHQSTWAFYLTTQFTWSTAHIGLVMAGAALAGALFQATAVAPIIHRLGVKRAAVLGATLTVATLTGTAFANAPWQLYAVQTVAVLSSFGPAAAQSWISTTATPTEQGTVQGALTAISATAETLVPITAAAAFAWSLTHATPGLPFAVAAAFTATSALLLSKTDRPRPHPTRPN